MQANKTADNQYLIPLIDGTIENIDIADGILLTTSEFVSQEDIEMTTTHDDLSLFQISFCIAVRRSLQKQAPPFLRLHLYGLFRHPNAFVMRNRVPTDFCSSRQDLCARLSAGYGGMKSVGNRSIVLSCL